MPSFESLAAALTRRRAAVRVGGDELAFECLDDLEAVLSRLVAELPGELGEVCPHFGVLWPSAVALAEVLSERLPGMPPPEVLELGCGLALPSIVAARHGARRVVATDKHPLAGMFLARNAPLNGASNVEYAELDWRRTAPSARFDLVVGSDLLYEAAQPGHLAALLPALLKVNGRALIADPGRRYVDAFVDLVEAAGCRCELAALRQVPHAEVLILEVRRAEAAC